VRFSALVETGDWAGAVRLADEVYTALPGVNPAMHAVNPSPLNPKPPNLQTLHQNPETAAKQPRSACAYAYQPSTLMPKPCTLTPQMALQKLALAFVQAPEGGGQDSHRSSSSCLLLSIQVLEGPCA
jgi:hypothetical protein